MPFVTHATFILSDMLLRYQAPEGAPDQLGLVLLPLSKAEAVVSARDHLETAATRHLPAHWQPVTAWHADSLVHLHIRGQPRPGAFAQGRTLRSDTAPKQFRITQPPAQTHCAHETVITTRLENDDGLKLTHELRHREGEPSVRIRTTVHNEGKQPITLELLSSFSLGGITPFASDDAPERLWLHRFRSAWSAEARHEAISIDALNLERSWVGHGVRAERFGQVGSLPTNGFFPYAALEDRAEGVFWAAKIAHPGSWQLELFRKGDQLSLSGGLADYELGHWAKQIDPGASFSTPEAMVTVCAGTLEETCDRLTLSQQTTAQSNRAPSEKALPIVFNEWCTSWGNPTHANLLALAQKLRGSGVRYLVIDDGWAERPGNGIQQNGDWIFNHTAFPHGLRATADAIRECGLIPGIWFEFEVINAGAKAFAETAHQLHRDGAPLEVGNRRFWDFRDPWVHAYLGERVLRFLQENHLGYLKVDYNDTIGLGCDGSESLGEGLRQHLEGVQRFFKQLKTAMPELVIENCSSGGHRAEPSFVALTDMTSFSDAHETPDIPLIAAGVSRLIPPAQNQIWAVLRKEDSLQRLSYSLAATFLGRMCLSGDVEALPPEAWEFTRAAIRLYQGVTPAIEHGRFRRHGEHNAAYQHLSGWQAVVSTNPDGSPAFVVWHTFAHPPGEISVPLPGSFGRTLSIRRELSADPTDARIHGNKLTLSTPRAWDGGVITFH